MKIEKTKNNKQPFPSSGSRSYIAVLVLMATLAPSHYDRLLKEFIIT